MFEKHWFKWTNNHSRAIPLAAKYTYFSVLIESAQNMMLFLWIGSENDRMFLFGSGYTVGPLTVTWFE